MISGEWPNIDFLNDPNFNNNSFTSDINKFTLQLHVSLQCNITNFLLNFIRLYIKKWKQEFYTSHQLKFIILVENVVLYVITLCNQACQFFKTFIDFVWNTTLTDKEFKAKKVSHFQSSIIKTWILLKTIHELFKWNIKAKYLHYHLAESFQPILFYDHRKD